MKNIDLIDDNNTDFNRGLCDKYYLYALLIQNIENSISLFTFFKNGLVEEGKTDIDDDTFIFNLVTILMQIYFNLFMLTGQFTHNDLHLGNILLIEAPPNQLYEFKFKYLNNENKYIAKYYKSRYLVKIIDYGRCEFKNSTLRDNVFSQIQKKNCDDLNTCGLIPLADKHGIKCVNGQQIGETVNNNIADNTPFVYISSAIQYDFSSNRTFFSSVFPEFIEVFSHFNFRTQEDVSNAYNMVTIETIATILKKKIKNVNNLTTKIFDPSIYNTIIKTY
jgi:predicted unusual protein kinase regulating ubiquinone biosynthesis (AarF/ABC1/UbiB family)